MESQLCLFFTICVFYEYLFDEKLRYIVKTQF